MGELTMTKTELEDLLIEFAVKKGIKMEYARPSNGVLCVDFYYDEEPKTYERPRPILQSVK